MTISLIPNVIDSAKSKLIEQFKNSPNINLMLELFIEETQEFENTLIDVLNELKLSDARGVNLDLFGEHLGRRRFGESDDEYRTLLRVQVGINTSEGTELTLIDVFKLLTNATVVKLKEFFPAEIQLFGNGDIINSIIIEQMSKVTATTVKIGFLLSGGGRPFAFRGGETVGGGFTSIHTTDPVTAAHGKFSSLILGS